MADLCVGRLIVDVGFACSPNEFLEGKVIGVNVKPTKVPSNYRTILIASNEALPFLNKIDAICAGEIIEHVETPIKFLVKCSKTLKRGGKFVLSTPNPITWMVV